VAAREAAFWVFAQSGVNGSCRQKAPWIEESGGVGAQLVETVLALFNNLGAAGGEEERDRGCQWPRTLGSCADQTKSARVTFGKAEDPTGESSKRHSQ
jgi:hypothetical protein